MILADQVTKQLLAFRDFFVGPLRLHLVENSGLLFGIDFGPSNYLLLAGAAAVLLYVFGFHDKLSNPGFVWVIAGSASNLMDRMRLGYVRDVIDLNFMSINLADVAIFAGLAIIMFGRVGQKGQSG